MADVTNASEWKKASQGIPLTVPSGKTALVRNPGMQVFLQRGLIPNSLMPIVRKAMSGKESDLKLEDITEAQLSELVQLYDAVTVYCVVEPRVYPIPQRRPLDRPNDITEELENVPLAERDQDLLYVDEVDFDDKMFIFQWAVGGTKDLEKFRAEQDNAVESLRRSKTMGSKAK